METIDFEKWPRKAHYRFFEQMDSPLYFICAAVDVTAFYQEIKRQGLPFYYSTLYAATKALDAIEAFRYRIHQQKIVKISGSIPSFVDLKKGSELFQITNLAIEGRDAAQYCAAAAEKSAAQLEPFPKEEDRCDMIFFSSIPWVSFTSLSNELTLDKYDSNPRITFGKYQADANGRLMMPVSLQVNHMLIDGLHIGQFFSEFQEMLDCFPAV
ncbi:MAG: CatA-like O-acetyltransferase [Enterococcaceae bacterium]|nr:CatA-like O-acetyltransferase [Enterococcaceae bacterium]MCI1919245.1 CatA-like O-acetyltransferase [Enterococcaceae bacterium]